MKKLIIGLFFTVIASANATMIAENVTICSATCTSAGKHIDHDTINSGIIYFANYNDDNSTNTNLCSSEAIGLPIASDRGASEVPFGIDVNKCSKILMGKYFGKKVDLILEEQSDGESYITSVKLK